MIKIKADTHCHTLASTHAYSTVTELAKTASDMGMEAIAVTDHGINLPDSPHIWHFHNLKNIPREINGVKILYGVEANIIDDEGNLDMPEELLKKLDIVNASIHNPSYNSQSGVDVTQAYEAVVNNPLTDVICHSGSPSYPYDYEKIVKLCRDKDKLIEINNHTFDVRRPSIDNCRKIAELCKKYETGIVVTSDAHICYDLGHYEHALSMLDEIDFPEELIINTSLEKLTAFIEKRKKLFSWKMGQQ